MQDKSSYEIALERIKEASRAESTSLILTSLNLENVPPEIGKLHNLSSLYLHNNRIKTLPPEIRELKNLKKFSLSNNLLDSVSPEIGQLTNLSTLWINNNKLKVLPPEVGELVNLKSLWLYKNHLTTLPPEIGNLINLSQLWLNNNELGGIPAEIGRLINLRDLLLNSNQLRSLPSEIGSLKKLKKLALQKNQLTSIPDSIGQLTNLEELILGDLFGGNQLNSLPSSISDLASLKKFDLSHNQIQALPSNIERLINLSELSLSNNIFGVLPKGITKLKNLLTLWLSGNELSELPPELFELNNLSVLWLSNNKLNMIPPNIGNLKNLTKLYFHDNKLVSLPPEIGEINNLSSLSLARNKLRSLPLNIRNLQNLVHLDLRKNPDLSIPPEILENRDNPRVILEAYFSVRHPINEAKLIFLGQGSVGKTSLIQHVVNHHFDLHEIKTEGIAINQWQIINRVNTEDGKQNIRLNIWDFGGQEIMHATHQFFLTKRSLYLLVIDARNSQEQNQVEYWLKIIQSFGGESPVLIVGNKIDQHPLDIDRTGLQKKYPNIVGVLETSAATSAGIEELKAAITDQVNNLPHVRDLLPETWFTVKTKLEELGRQSNFITHDKYLELCAENEVSDETSQRTLIGFLHDLGVVLHFQDDPRLEALGILNPQWVTNGVYKILNSHTLFQNKGVLTTSMLDEILNLPEYPRGKRLFIVDMMKKFELCYDILPDKTFLVPDLLPKDQPDLKFNGIPAFEYVYPVLPSSVITRFIVRMNQKIDGGLVWRTGVVLKIGENTALVKADIEDRKITIAIDGLEHTRRDALSAIRYQLDEIHNSIKGLSPQKMVPIPNAPNAEPLEYETLLMLEREGQEEYLVRDGKRLVKVNVRQVLSGIESEAARREIGSRITNIYVGGDVGGSIVTGDENEVKK